MRSKYIELVIVAVIVGMLAWAMSSILAQRDVDVAKACLAAQVVTERSNALADALIEIERNNPFADDGPLEQAVIDARIRVWAAYKSEPIACEE